VIRFCCPQCQKVFDVSSAQAGIKFHCDACGQRIQVPSPSAPTPLSVANPIQIASGRRGVWMALVACVLLLLSAGGVLLALSWRRGVGELDRPPIADQDPSLAEKARRILTTHCYRCHGENGAAEGGFNYVLDPERLAARRKIISGDAEKSRLYRRVRKGEMPPEDEKPRPSADEVAVLKQWIDAGAPSDVAAPKTGFITDEQLLATLETDLGSLPERDRRFMRYFTITHLHNAGLSEDELQTYRHALAKLLNSLSWNREIVKPRPVDPARTIYRVDVRDYQWSDRVWKRILSSYPFGVLSNSPAARRCYAATDNQLSHVRADWFVATASRPPLYHEVLQLPEREGQLQEQLHINVEENIRQERVARAGFNSSGISRNNRLIERHKSPYGSYWRSYDFSDNLGRHNLFAHPLGPGRDANCFEHQGGEIIFSLPNGLHAFMLVDQAGRRLDKAPLSIVSDARRPDRAVENGVSCMSCHARGLIPKRDQVRTHLQRNENAFTPAEADTIRALYPPDAVLQELLTADNERFRAAVEQTGSRLAATEPVAALVLQFEKELDLSLAGAELGLKPAELSEQLDRSAVLARTLGPLRIQGGTVQRQVFTEAFPELVRELHLGTHLRP
jgi:hypothetical protein